jgi:hypothetical protein
MARKLLSGLPHCEDDRENIASGLHGTSAKNTIDNGKPAMREPVALVQHDGLGPQTPS